MTDSINASMAALEERLARVEDIGEIERLHYQYGYYLDNRMWGEVAETFCDDSPSIEIGQRGLYVGKDRVRRFLTEVLGGGRWGLLQDEIINHIQLQLVTTLADDRMSAEVRSRALVQGNSPPGSGKMLLAEGIYENRFVRESGHWKIKHVGWVPTYYFEVAGFDGAVFDSGPESTAFPPDRSAPPRDAGLGRRFKPFHYRHPLTGDVVPSPSGEMPGGDEP
ncbi:nuclear transport factor 2 family protein [Maritimibacter sp. DP07]|uniref:Nuclear transport factor 2 family protein n=1 Tax=Maritimibacter harenae TaxID=2606218 RepID=A0A845M6B0_9RHOB|nr:nuclear transport factor 2 family protein [Maritimibacter harenae]MZR11691.1 nuclear transport factor 2 family protein [Maritimibacter harenae]